MTTAESVATGLRSSGTVTRQRVDQGMVLLPTVMIVVMLVGASLFYVWCRLQAVHLAYPQTRTAVKIQGLEKENEELRGQVAQLKSPERIERVAREQLGLSYPSPDQIRILDLEPGPIRVSAKSSK
jgi:cell division protein FtsL